MLNFSSARDRMVEAQVARRGIRDSRVLDAMREPWIIELRQRLSLLPDHLRQGLPARVARKVVAD
jgi:hypothetical protein